MESENIMNSNAVVDNVDNAVVDNNNNNAIVNAPESSLETYNVNINNINNIQKYKGDEYDDVDDIKILNYYKGYTTTGVWLYKSNKNEHWWIYPESINTIMEEKYLSGSTETSIPTAIGNINVNFIDKIQKMKSAPRSIIRIRNDSKYFNKHPINYYEWVYITNHGTVPFHNSIQDLITKIYLNHDHNHTHNVFTNNNTYSLNFKDMIERNIVSGKMHLIQFKLKMNLMNNVLSNNEEMKAIKDKEEKNEENKSIWNKIKQWTLI